MTAIITRGREDADQWVTKYTVSYKENKDDADWADYINRDTNTTQVNIRRLVSLGAPERIQPNTGEWPPCWTEVIQTNVFCITSKE